MISGHAILRSRFSREFLQGCEKYLREVRATNTRQARGHIVEEPVAFDFMPAHIEDSLSDTFLDGANDV